MISSVNVDCRRLTQRLKDRLQILITASWFPSDVHPTLGNFVMRHAAAIASLHHVEVLYFAALPNPEDEERIESYTLDGVSITMVYYHKGLLKLIGRTRALRKGIEVLEASHPGKFDLIHHHVTWPEAWQGVWLYRKFKIPLLLTEHWTGFLEDQRGPLSRKVKLFCGWISRHVSLHLPVTNHLAAAMQKAGMRGKYRVIPNVVDTNLFRIASKPEQPIRFLHVSSLSDSHKNISGLLRAWKLACQNNADIHLTIGGDGPWQEVKDLATELEIPSGRIDFFGEELPEHIAGRMSEAHTLILFSNYENLPCVIGEALSCGMRIISTDVGGIAEHIDAAKGTLIKARDEAGLVAAILSEAAIQSEVNRETLRTYACDHFSVGAVALQFDKAYRDVLNQNYPES